MEVLFGTLNKGIAKVANHPDAKVGDKIRLTDEELKDLVDVVDPECVDIDDESLCMVVSHILEDIIIGDLATLGEVAGFGLAEYDSPFW